MYLFLWSYATEGLENLIKMSHKFTELEAKKWFRQIASAFKFLHDQIMGHCDIKPSNILCKQIPGSSEVMTYRLAHLRE
jgi:serine/threonine protein kinase